MKYGERIREKSPYAAATTQLAAEASRPPLEQRMSEKVATPYVRTHTKTGSKGTHQDATSVAEHHSIEEKDA